MTARHAKFDPAPSWRRELMTLDRADKAQALRAQRAAREAAKRRRRRELTIARLWERGALSERAVAAASEIEIALAIGVGYYGGNVGLGATRVDQAHFANPHIGRLTIVFERYAPWRALWAGRPAVVDVVEGVVGAAQPLRLLEMTLHLGHGTAARYLAEGLDSYGAIAGWD